MKKSIFTLCFLVFSVTTLASSNKNFNCSEAYLKKLNRLADHKKLKNTALDVGTITALAGATVGAGFYIPNMGSLLSVHEPSGRNHFSCCDSASRSDAYGGIPEAYGPHVVESIIDVIARETNKKNGTSLTYEDVQKKILAQMSDDTFLSDSPR